MLAALLLGLAHGPSALGQQESLLGRLEALSQRLDGDDPADVALARQRLREEHERLSERFASGQAFTLEEARALSSAARCLVDLPAAERPAGRDNLALLEEGLAAERAHYDPFGTAMAECWIAEELLWQGRMQEARTRLDGALARAAGEAYAREAVVRIHANLADLERLRGSWGEAQGSLVAAREQLAELDLEGPTRRALEALLDGIEAQLYLDLGLPDQGAPFVTRLRAAADELGGASLQVAATILESSLGLCTNDDGGVVARVEALLDQSPQLAEGTPRRAQLELRLGLGLEGLERRGKRPAGGARAAFAKALAHPLLPDVEALTAELGLARLALADGAAEEAAQQLRRARSRLESPESANGRRNPVLEAALLAALEARVASARNAAPRELEQALAMLESSYARFLDQWANVPLRKGGVGFLTFTGRRVLLCELVRLELEVRGAQLGARVALERVLEAQGLGSLARWIDAGPRSLADVERILVRRGTGYLLFLPGPYDSFVFELDAGGVRCTRLPSCHGWEELQAEWTSTLRRIPRGGSAAAADPRVLELGRRIAADLFPPELVERARELEQVGVVGWDLLSGMPLEALPVRAPGGESLLGLELALFYLPSFPVGCALAARAERRPEGSLLVLAAPELSPALLERWSELTPLTWSPRRTRALERLYARVDVLTGKQAHLSALAAAAPSASLLSIVTHGVYDLAEELPAAFVLSETEDHDGVVSSDDLERLELPPMVLLTVCGAARGPIRSGDDGISHLGGALLRGGSSAVVLSRQEIEQESALDMMEGFHAGVVAGRRPARALLEARRASHARDPGSFHDALVHLVGLGDLELALTAAPAASASAQSSRATLAWAGGGAALLGAVLLALRRAKRAA